MLIVLQGETGGAFAFSYPASIPASSGFIYAVAEDRVMYRFDATLLSGALYVAKSGLSNLPVGRYTILPWVLDAANLLYFVKEDDLLVSEVPDFFTDALLVSGDSVLVRLNALEAAFDTVLAGDKTYRHIQAIPAITWVITHNLGKYTSIHVTDTTKRSVYGGDVKHISPNQLQVTFSAAFAGEAYIN